MERIAKAADRSRRTHRLRVGAWLGVVVAGVLVVGPGRVRAEASTAPTRVTTTPAVVTPTVAETPVTPPAPPAASARTAGWLARYRAQTPYAAQLVASPTAILEPVGGRRVGISEFLLQQVNFGVDDWLQVGFNTVFLVVLVADAKIRLTPEAAPVQAALLVGGGLPTVQADQAGLYGRLALSGPFGGGRARLGLWNVTVSLASMGQWLGTAPPEDWILRRETSAVNLSAGADVPLGSGHWSLPAEFMLHVPLQLGPGEEAQRFLMGGVRYSAGDWGVQFGLVLFLTRKAIEEYFLGFPFVDLTLRF